MKYTELHNHLYGSLSAEDLFEIGIKNKFPRWVIYTELFEKLYMQKVDTENFFKKYETPEKLKEIYLFNFSAPFLEFQNRFNLIIALCKFDSEEIKEVTRRVFERQIKENISYAEYRLTLNPFATEQDYFDKILSVAESLEEVEKKTSAFGRVIISFHRFGKYWEQYSWVKNAMKRNEQIQKYLVGIDFSNVEENDPPKNKKVFFEKILKDNLDNKNSSLAILYHVGESYLDKTPISASRWVLESSKLGVMRLGHAIALGRNHQYLEGKKIVEKVSERIDQLNFELENFEELESFHFKKEKKEILVEIENLKFQNFSKEIEIVQDEKFLENTFKFQNFCMYKISKSNSIIEVCPTSNLRIGQLDNLNYHPIHRFIENKIKLTISTDDPGIFDTNIENEFDILETSNISKVDLEKIRLDSFQYKSEILSERE